MRLRWPNSPDSLVLSQEKTLLYCDMHIIALFFKTGICSVTALAVLELSL